MGLRSVWVRRAALVPLACLIASCSAASSAEPTNPPYDTSVADGLAPRMAPAEVVAAARAYLDTQTPELAVPDMHIAAAITAIRAVVAADAMKFDPCIPAETGAQVVWVTFGRGDYLNLRSHPWSNGYMPNGTYCEAPSSSGTIVIDDATGAILGVYPGRRPAASMEPPSPTASRPPVADASPITVPNESPMPAGSGTIYDTPFGCPTDNSVWLNLWQAQGTERSLAVCAGEVANDPQQGLVQWVESGPPPAFANLVGNTLLTPRRAGAVRVTAAIGDVLTLTSTDGIAFTFDAAYGVFR